MASPAAHACLILAWLNGRVTPDLAIRSEATRGRGHVCAARSLLARLGISTTRAPPPHIRPSGPFLYMHYIIGVGTDGLQRMNLYGSISISS